MIVRGTTPLVIFTVVSALGLVGLLVVETIFIAHEAAAAPLPNKGCRNSLAFNASQGNCFHGIR
jgi:hypothetical protein